MKFFPSKRAKRIERRLRRLYGDAAPALMDRFGMILGRYGVDLAPAADDPVARWTEKDSVLITYPDTIRDDGHGSLQTLHRFLTGHAQGVISTIHFLPFFPWSSDGGFSVIDYRQVDPRYGSWADIEKFREGFRLMFDLVLNHCSRQSPWFRDYVVGNAPGRYYFLPTDPETDLSAVVRPRSLPLLSRAATRDGESWLWTTFSSDQVDLNWKNPDVFFEFLDILFLYLSKGARIIRCDAVAFLWKEIGTSCLHLPETHEVVRLFRDVLDLVAPEAILLTETNVPHEENISYFGDGDEAHMVYNFTLPPLMLYCFLRNDASLLTAWTVGLPGLRPGEAFFNFAASHDGIGVRPLQGVVDGAELEWLIGEVKRRGGLVSTRSLPDGSDSPYELNTTYRDALSDPDDPELGLTRFMCSQALLLAFRGLPALYIHSLLGTPNDLAAALADGGENRTINRRKYELVDLMATLEDPMTIQGRVFRRLLCWLERRRNHPAFHPEAPMEIVDLGARVFGFLRTSKDGKERIACLFNFTGIEQPIDPTAIHPGLAAARECREILGAEMIDLQKARGLVLPPYAARWLQF